MNTTRAIELIEALVQAGVRDAVLCPGSRSTPLALAADAHPDIRLHIHIDERGGAFHALGIARGSGRPGLIITTSGTAVSNLLPAMTEAHQANVPLIALTADRPDRLRDTGANQTIDQVGLFDRVTRLSLDLPPADEEWTSRPIQNALTTYPLGPIHLNQPFDKPLEPTAKEHDALAALSKQPARTTKPPSPPRPDGRIPGISLGHLGPQGLIVCGPDTGHALLPQLRRLSDALHAPVLADGLSGVRFGSGFLDADAFADHEDIPDPHWVVQFGQTPTSRAVAGLIARAGTRLRFDWSGRGWDDLGPCTMTSADPARWIDKAIAEARTASGAEEWLHLWHEMHGAAKAHGPAPDDEAAWVRSILAGHPERLFVGNSMPVRDLERYGRSDASIQVFANRGASGIDGTIATACGIARAGPTTAVIGDLAFVHDQSSLALWHDQLHLVVIDNGGGRIFEHLPIAQATTRFHDLFVTPQRLDIAKACEAAGVPIHHATPDGLAKLEPGITVVKTPGGQAHKRQAIRREVHKAVGSVLAQHL